MLKTGDQFPDYEVFTYWHAFFLVGAIVTYIVDLSLGKLSFLQFKSVKPLNVINLITLFLLITVHFSIRSYDLVLILNMNTVKPGYNEVTGPRKSDRYNRESSCKKVIIWVGPEAGPRLMSLPGPLCL